MKKKILPKKPTQRRGRPAGSKNKTKKVSVSVTFTAPEPMAKTMEKYARDNGMYIQDVARIAVAHLMKSSGYKIA